MFLFERRWCNSTSALPVPTLPLLHGEPQAPGGGGPASSFFFLKLERPSQSPRYRRPEDICGARRKLSLACGSSRFSASRGRETAGKQVPLPAPEPERTRGRSYGSQLWTRWGCLLSSTWACRLLRDSTHPGPQPTEEGSPLPRVSAQRVQRFRINRRLTQGDRAAGRCRRQLEF